MRIHEARVAIKFSLPTYIASTTVLKKATLSLYNSSNLSSNFVNGVKTIHLLTTNWKQTYATWEYADSLINWKERGGDYDTTPIMTYTDTNWVKWEEFDVTKAVKKFIKNPASNFGFILKFRSYQPNHMVVYTSSEEIDSALHRPKLTIKIENTTSVVSNVISMQNQFQVVTNTGWVMPRFPNSGPGTFMIFDIQGKKLASFNLSEIKKQITLPATLSSGMHIITWTGATERKIAKAMLDK